MKLSVSTIIEPPEAVEPSRHPNETRQRAGATCSVKPFAPDATAGTSSDAKAASRGATDREGLRMSELLSLGSAQRAEPWGCNIGNQVRPTPRTLVLRPEPVPGLGVRILGER